MVIKIQGDNPNRNQDKRQNPPLTHKESKATFRSPHDRDIHPPKIHPAVPIAMIKKAIKGILKIKSRDLRPRASVKKTDDKAQKVYSSHI
jgi:hypothetical protein